MTRCPVCGCMMRFRGLDGMILSLATTKVYLYLPHGDATETVCWDCGTWASKQGMIVVRVP